MKNAQSGMAVPRRKRSERMGAAGRRELMELDVFVRLRARDGKERAVEEALLEVMKATREEAGCVSIHAFRSMRDRQLFYIHSHWVNEAAFQTHAGLAHTKGFRDGVDALLEVPLEVTRTERIG
jgi:quinol monooxygenase YgiN